MKYPASTVLALLMSAAFSTAQVPQLINYQGRVAVGGVNFDGSGQFKFALVDGAGSTSYWSNDGTSVGGAEPTAPVTLGVTKGLYSVLLGDATLSNMTVVPATVFSHFDVRLRVWFNDGTHDFQQLVPDQRIAAVGYAMMAGTAQTVPDGVITQAKLAAGAVGSTQIAAGAVLSAHIANGAITSQQLGAGVVGASNIVAGAVGATQLTKPPQSGTISLTWADLSPVDFSVSFVEPFNATPVVAVGLESVGGIFAATVLVRNKTVSGFSGQVNAAIANPVIVAATDWPDYRTSLAVVNGNPAISYAEANTSSLRYVRATDASGTAWGTPITLNSLGRYASLVVINGNPAISHYDGASATLKYVRATDANGAAWGTPVTLDSAGTGENGSLAVVNGNPAISYYAKTNSKLKYVRATDANGAAWAPPVTLDSATAGECISLAVVNGNPAISYSAQTNSKLTYVRATDANGAAWGTPVTADSAVGAFNSSLAVVNGNPAISYYDLTNFKLRYVRATDADGAAWGTPVTLDSAATGRYCSLAVVNGKPSISYYRASSEALKYVRATDANGAAWGTPVILQTENNSGFLSSQVLVNGSPAISYACGSSLKFIRPFPTFTVNWLALEP